MFRNNRTILLVLILALGTIMEVADADYTFGTPTNLGPIVNSSAHDFSPSITADGLELYFHSDRPGGEGTHDIWVSTRASKEDDWGALTNLGAVNTPDWEIEPCISADGLELYFVDWGLWVVRRATVSDPWGERENDSTININTSNVYSGACLSSDGLSLFLFSWEEKELYVSTRPTRDDLWSEPVNLGPTVNGEAEHDRRSLVGAGESWADD
ncbi:MAG: TolB family protein [Planctomycetota bacterium]|jgi:Tol biopolymer transport system component